MDLIHHILTPDSVYNVVNMNLSVINFPDSLGLACDFQPFSFYMGGKRAYKGLPNNPDYDLPALAGSPCDTLVGLVEAPENLQAALNVFYHKAWEKAFINASNLKGKAGKLLVYDMQGKVVLFGVASDSEWVLYKGFVYEW
ncbi:MAG: hypothetical protein IPL22_10415 [Bacteroidetes bacterium]|nr:hypothetical protein [Bacteroidota bacterium]